MRPFVGNPCGYGFCKRDDCENCWHWKPVIYIGKNYYPIKLPRWNWLVNLLYKAENWLLTRKGW